MFQQGDYNVPSRAEPAAWFGKRSTTGQARASSSVQGVLSGAGELFCRYDIVPFRSDYVALVRQRLAGRMMSNGLIAHNESEEHDSVRH